MDYRSKMTLPVLHKQTLKLGKLLGIKFLLVKLVRGKSMNGPVWSEERGKSPFRENEDGVSTKRSKHIKTVVWRILHRLFGHIGE